MSLVKFQKLQKISDDRGCLVVAEAQKNIPFEIRRVYFLFSLNSDFARGFHAHFTQVQVAICISGKCRIVLDDGHSSESVWLESPSKGIIIDKMIWHEMHDFSEDCILIVFADAWYNENDYIRNYDAFLNEVTNANTPTK